MLRMLRPLIGEDIDLLWRPASRPWQVKIDPGQVDQILANLCVNARDAIAGTGKVTIETENVLIGEDYSAEQHYYVRPGRYVRLAVSDDGSGMDRETLKNIFEPFYTTKPAGGAGGMAILRTLPHGHVAAVLAVCRHLGLEQLLASRVSHERTLTLAMIVARVIDPRSKLATVRALSTATATSSLSVELGLEVNDERQLYEAMDWLLARQQRIEAKLAERHLQEGSLVLYDLSSSGH